MTKQDFLNDYRHEIEGWILDAAMGNRSGASMSIWLKQLRAKVESKLSAIYDELCPAPALPIVPEAVQSRLAGPMTAARTANGTNGHPANGTKR